MLVLVIQACYVNVHSDIIAWCPGALLSFSTSRGHIIIQKRKKLVNNQPGGTQL